jgi:hypothetical protein
MNKLYQKPGRRDNGWTATMYSMRKTLYSGLVALPPGFNAKAIVEYLKTLK